ncbi:7TM diverse intracellular signaling domain-containing protein [Sulfurovum sp.]|uniref:7TM diverse intracellular signaling domain-containing protein n=1 Tax=Sulfurovum sp. TaxID=1969726 RepID=UPI00286804A7|nr:7TM diverse intracellular signaling domain-containing protein [Sulfurovum sp.]
MTNTYIKNLRFLALIFIFISTLSLAKNIDISKKIDFSLLEHSSVYFDQKHHTLSELTTQDLFIPYHKPYINRGVSSESIWLTFTLENDSEINIEKVLVLSSPLVEYISLYEEKYSQPFIKGALYISNTHKTLFPYFHINLAPQTSKQYYLEVKSTINPIDFGLWIYDELNYQAEDQVQQFINILLIGMVLALMLYSFMLFFYTRDKSYLYYSFYLFALIYQQLTYLGLTQIYFPVDFVILDINITVFKITLLVITAALFSMHFLKTRNMPFLHKGYIVFISLSLLEMVIFSFPQFHNLDIVILTGTIFIIYNLWAGYISYHNGNKQARLFLLGFGIVFTSYILLILDALGFTSIMQDFQNILIITTALESLILSLAFADRYIILQKEKEKVDARILSESAHRTKLIKEEVVNKTKELNTALEIKELLLKEVHHRVKNNLQIILSIIRLQNDEINDEAVKKKFINLENRINAISKTYNMLLIKDDLEEIDMQEYIDSLLLDIQGTFHFTSQDITISTDIDAMIPLRESVYIGLIINELVTNTYKYAFDNNEGTIAISLKQTKKEYLLVIEDNGKGYSIEKNHQTLGLKLISILVYDQLGGVMETHTNSHTKYIIRFSI